ncbi:phosphoethanolamine--lipid A transferase [Paucibacter sp. B2R-40]|uniref:phosphoethanolamine transferase n=1 Tax=Paucibacter sp. B2R-40 TaxID=2893554 RepID=UPI0021E46D75|nr:phosphoethanolamine--lipid A transferase [Paucibacter sp. B2R-40]MCV2352692.1 phosphoethanolamine--lipid A transferase [Paucibacter sp. B2R-40]
MSLFKSTPSTSLAQQAGAAQGSASRLTIPATVEQVLLAVSLLWALTANRFFFSAALKGRSFDDPSAWGFAAAMVVLVLALHLFLLALVANRWTLKPLLVVLIITTAFASWFMQAFGVYLDPTMVRNTLRTDPAEASELISAALLLHVLIYAGLPLLLLWRVRIVNRPWRRAVLVRLGLIVVAVLAMVASVMAVFQPFSSLMRNHKEIRYLITPSNYVWSLGSTLASEARGAAKPRQAVGLDAAAGPSWAGRTKPKVVVMVIGETARAANWGLNGYTRQTTPQLAEIAAQPGSSLISFRDVQACGTNTETSLPCMFSAIGRRDYDEARIRGTDSLLHIVARAGVGVQWRDNQSGCKGVCDGLPNDAVSKVNAPGLCEGERCLDEGLIADLDGRLSEVVAGFKPGAAPQFWLMHQLGNHGPSYFRRYPPAFKRFVPACEKDDLRLCSKEEIANAYDNALLYTDHVLASLIAKLKSRAAEVDTVLLYVSDHGESLGENGLFLHGIPYAIAPDVQTRVPMLMWASSGFANSTGLDWDCLRGRAAQTPATPVSHDHLFHTLMGLLDVRSTLLEPSLDLAGQCRVPGNEAVLK